MSHPISSQCLVDVEGPSTRGLTLAQAWALAQAGWFLRLAETDDLTLLRNAQAADAGQSFRTAAGLFPRVPTEGKSAKDLTVRYLRATDWKPRTDALRAAAAELQRLAPTLALKSETAAALASLERTLPPYWYGCHPTLENV